MTDEHIIPSALGGTLVVRFLCCRCNKELGSYVDATAKHDPSIRYAVEALKSQIPNFHGKFTEGQPYLAHSPAGQVRGRFKRGTFRIDSYRLNDGSLIQPTPEARRSIETMIRRQGRTVDEIRTALKAFDQVPENTSMSITEELSIAKWSVEKIEPLANGDLMDPLILLKIGYEFLALHLYQLTYEDNAPLRHFRAALCREISITDVCEVEYLHGEDYKPFHGIVFEGNNPTVQVQIRLFGWLAYRLKFFGLAIEGPRLAYTQFLDQNTVHWERVDHAPNESRGTGESA
jgi:hypothetical protein